MPGKRYKSKRPKTQRHRRIPNSTKELVVQYRAMGLTYNDIVNKTLLGYSTVEHICTKWAPDNPDRVKKARAKAMEELASRVNEKALMALEHITPDSLTHDRIEHRDENGKLTGVSHSGPTAMQIATTAGIMIDKARVLEDRAASLRGEAPNDLGPDNLQALLSSISDRVKRLTSVNADLNTGAIQARIVELSEKAAGDTYFDADAQVVPDED